MLGPRDPEKAAPLTRAQDVLPFCHFPHRPWLGRRQAAVTVPVKVDPRSSAPPPLANPGVSKLWDPRRMQGAAQGSPLALAPTPLFHVHSLRPKVSQ